MPKSDWTIAHEQMVARITEHPLFPKLVREVAVAEQTFKRQAKRFYNSLTYGEWLRRGERWPRKGGKRDRAYLFANRMQDDLNIWPTLPRGEAIGMIYGTAREFVRARKVAKKS